MSSPYNPPQDPYLDILFEDEAVLAINKPSGLLSVPGRLEDKKDSVQSRAQEHQASALTVHRLDMETSGVIIMALDPESHRTLSAQFQNRETEKSYIARLYGRVEEDRGSVDLPLRCDWPNRPKQMVDHDLGKASLTHWSVLNRTNHETLVMLTPITGRSHQLRVHMAELGHPILGDRLYATGEALAAAPHLQLHAESLTISHPNSGERLTFKAPRPF